MDECHSETTIIPYRVGYINLVVLGLANTLGITGLSGMRIEYLHVQRDIGDSASAVVEVHSEVI